MSVRRKIYENDSAEPHHRLVEASYGLHCRGSTDFSRAIFPRSLASRTRARIILARVDPRPRRRHARTGQGQARSHPTYRTDRRPALNFIHTPRGRLSVLTRNVKWCSHGSDDTAIRRRRNKRSARLLFSLSFIEKFQNFSNTELWFSEHLFATIVLFNSLHLFTLQILNF